MRARGPQRRAAAPHSPGDVDVLHERRGARAPRLEAAGRVVERRAELALENEALVLVGRGEGHGTVRFLVARAHREGGAERAALRLELPAAARAAAAAHDARGEAEAAAGQRDCARALEGPTPGRGRVDEERPHFLHNHVVAAAVALNLRDDRWVGAVRDEEDLLARRGVAVDERSCARGDAERDAADLWSEGAREPARKRARRANADRG